MRSKGEVTRSLYALNRGQRVGQPRRGRGRRTAAGVSPLRVGVSNRQLPSSEPARSASRETREPLLRPLPSALGQRPLVELRVRERSGKWRRLSQPAGGMGGPGRRSRRIGEEAGNGGGSLALARRPGALRLARGAAPPPRGFGGGPGLWLATGAWHSGGMPPRRAPSLSGANRSPAPTRRLAVPRGPRAARRARLCEVAPIVQRGRLSQGRRRQGESGLFTSMPV